MIGRDSGQPATHSSCAGAKSAVKVTAWDGEEVKERSWQIGHWSASSVGGMSLAARPTCDFSPPEAKANSGRATPK